MGWRQGHEDKRLDNAEPPTQAHAEGWRLAEALAKRMNALVPEGFAVTAQAGLIGVHTGELFMGGTGLGEMYAENGDGISVALDSIATDISEETTEPWPLTVAEFSGQGALAWEKWDDAAQEIRCGYRLGERIVLQLDPIPYAEFRLDPADD